MGLIKYVAYVSPTTGEIASLVFAKASNNPPEGLDANQNLEVVYITDNIGPGDLFMKTHYRNFETNEWVVREAAPSPVAEWTGSSWFTDPEKFANAVRGERQWLLTYSDWTQFNDCGLSDAKKQEWAVYRQALRDITDNLPSGIDRFSDIPWPVEPSNA